MASDWIKKRFTHQFVLVALIVAAVMIMYTLSPFLDAILGSIILYVLFRPVMRNLLDQRKWKKGLAALSIILLALVLVLVPILVMSYMIIPKLSIFFSEGSITMKVLKDADISFQQLTGFRLMTSENITKLQSEAAGFITNFLGQSMIILTNVLLLFFFFYYMLTNTGRIEKLMDEYLPFSQDKIDRFSKELESQTFSNALGSPLLAIIQALSAALGYWIFGLPDPLFWGVMTGFFSFFPVVGSVLIWLPAAIYQLSAGYIWQGAAIAIYGIAIISTIDNIFRFIFQKKFADVHPVITIVGVISGLQLFGVSGIIFGPLLLSYFLILMKIFKEEYLSN
ncbi:MAG TPA: AI-2E family transporter [Bacteroidia bacterium]|nr:AI-2E family transporter [Bacteroidia bacterium]